MEVKKYPISYLVGIFITATVLEVFLTGYDSIYKVISMLAVNMGIVFLISAIDGELNNRKMLSIWGIFNSGVGIFSLAVAVAYSCMFFAKYKEFTLTCDMLYQSVNSFIDTISTPLDLSLNQVNSAKDKLNYFYSTKMEDAVLSGTQPDILILSGKDLLTGSQNIPFTGNSMSGQAYNNPGEGSVWDRINAVRGNVLQILSDRKDSDKGICDFTIDRIRENYKKPSFSLSVILSLSVLLGTFLRTVMLIVCIINFIVFRILMLFKVYKIQKVVEEVEEVE